MPHHSSPQVNDPERLYFAFGSNLHLGQMARRCPESRYIGTGHLHDYRFQINERGYANVVPSPGNCVEGLVYLLSKNDEERLDQHEGVPTAYEKHSLPVEVYTASTELVGRSVLEVSQQLEESKYGSVRDGSCTSSVQVPDDDQQTPQQRQDAWQAVSTLGPRDNLNAQQRHSNSNDGRHTEINSTKTTQIQNAFSPTTQGRPTNAETTKALVYLSLHFQTDSHPREEYIDRMNAGIIDARKLGMSDSYINNHLRRYIYAKERNVPK
ncbi:MAG: hypothetical protein Q9216_005843 [Gyalolechia sp. 2 TL-2023]